MFMRAFLHRFARPFISRGRIGCIDMRRLARWWWIYVMVTLCDILSPCSPSPIVVVASGIHIPGKSIIVDRVWKWFSKPNSYEKRNKLCVGCNVFSSPRRQLTVPKLSQTRSSRWLEIRQTAPDQRAHRLYNFIAYLRQTAPQTSNFLALASERACLSGA